MLLASLFNAGVGRLSFASPWITATGAVTFAIFSIVVLLPESVFGFKFVDPFFRKATVRQRRWQAAQIRGRRILRGY